MFEYPRFAWFTLVPNENILHHLFYADDNCIFSTTPRGLQSKLDLIYNLSVKLGLEVNLDKTKIIVFRKGGFYVNMKNGIIIASRWKLLIPITI